MAVQLSRSHDETFLQFFRTARRDENFMQFVFHADIANGYYNRKTIISPKVGEAAERENTQEKKKRKRRRFFFDRSLRRGCNRLFIAGIIMGFCSFETIFTTPPCSRAYERTTSLQLHARRVFMVRAALLVRLKLYWPVLVASFTAAQRP